MKKTIKECDADAFLKVLKKDLKKNKARDLSIKEIMKMMDEANEITPPAPQP